MKFNFILFIGLFLSSTFLIENISAFNCTDTLCENGGTCIPGDPNIEQFGATCVCLPDFNGMRCESFSKKNINCVEMGCQNGGLCIEGDPTTCVCMADFAGLKCQLKRFGPLTAECDSSNCSNRGQCVQNIVTDEFSCVCDYGYYGFRCANSIQFCLNDNPCQNGATCYPVGDIGYTCACPVDFTGKDCEEYRRKPCDYNLCKNDGICSIKQNGMIHCECIDGFIGTACEINTSDCENKTCNNRGICLAQMNGDYQCSCASLFGGKDCEITDLCIGSECQNNGICQNKDENDYRCICPKGFYGKNCEFSECADTSTSFSTTPHDVTTATPGPILNEIEKIRDIIRKNTAHLEGFRDMLETINKYGLLEFLRQQNCQNNSAFCN